MLVDEDRIIVWAGPATCQLSLQAGDRRVVQRHQSRLAELGLADQQTVAGHVRDRQFRASEILSPVDESSAIKVACVCERKPRVGRSRSAASTSRLISSVV